MSNPKIAENRNMSRRELLGAATSATAAALLAACGADAVEPVDGGDGSSPDLAQPARSDVETLNALLAAEYAALKAYDAGAAILQSPPAGDAADALAPTALAIAAHFRAQHGDHA